MKYCMNEKYSLQEYDGKIRDSIVDEINTLNRNAILVCMFIYKFKMFMTTRKINDRDLNCTLVLIYYDRDDNKPSKNNIDNGFIGPDKIEGAAVSNRVFVYVPISLNTAPFEIERLNEYCSNDIYRGCTKNLKLFDCAIDVNNYNSINDSIKRIRNKYDANIESFIDCLPDECRHSKKTIGVNINYVLKTIKHELTHVLDRNTASLVNHFNGLDVNGVNKYGLELALNILYMLWSRTEFNAFTQTFGKNVDSLRKIAKSKYINRVSLDDLERSFNDGGSVKLTEVMDDLNEDLDELSGSEYDVEFWDSIKEIVIEGSRDGERYGSMTPIKFRNYFISTTKKLIEKFKHSILKNIASQNTYENDISNIAAEIRDAVDNVISDNNSNKDVIELSFSFHCYFKNIMQSCRVYVNTESLYSRDTRVNNASISNNSMIHITIEQLNINYDATPTELFGSENNPYVYLYREMITKKRKSLISRYCINLAEDLYNTLNRNVIKK